MIMKECYVGSMSKGEVSANGTTYKESNVTANKDLNFASGKDTNIKGVKAERLFCLMLRLYSVTFW